MPTLPAGVVSARWRRRFRRYAHWLLRQEANRSVGIGTVSSLTPALGAAEVLALQGVSTALTGLGYAVPTIPGASAITPP
jgi:hypothetical protein